MGRNLVLHMEKHQEMARSHKTAPAPFRRGPSEPEIHAAAISPPLRDNGMSWVKKIANGDPPPVDCCIYRLPVDHGKNNPMGPCSILQHCGAGCHWGQGQQPGGTTKPCFSQVVPRNTLTMINRIKHFKVFEICRWADTRVTTVTMLLHEIIHVRHQKILQKWHSLVSKELTRDT